MPIHIGYFLRGRRTSRRRSSRVRTFPVRRRRSRRHVTSRRRRGGRSRYRSRAWMAHIRGMRKR